MAIIYDFSAYRTPRLMRSVSQQMGGVVSDMHALNGYLRNIEVKLGQLKEVHRVVHLQLGAYVSRLERTMAFARSCSDACELNSIEQMIEERDHIIHERLSN